MLLPTEKKKTIILSYLEDALMASDVEELQNIIATLIGYMEFDGIHDDALDEMLASIFNLRQYNLVRKEIIGIMDYLSRVESL